jgi:integrase
MSTVSLMWMAKTDTGWRRFPVVKAKNGRVQKGVALVDGKPTTLPDGHFEMRFYEGRQARYKNVGDDPTEALNLMATFAKQREARASASAAGLTVAEPEETRRTITKESKRWVKDAEDRNAMEAAEVNRVAMSEFVQANPGLVYVDEITAEHAKRYWAWLRKQGLGDRTIYNRHMRLTGFLKFADVEYKKWKLRAPKYEKKLPDVYTDDQVASLMQACKRDYHRVLIQVLAKTGLRDQELMHLEWSDLDLKAGTLRVRGKAAYDWNIKDYEQREIPLPAELVKLLKSWREANPKAVLVLPSAGGKPNGKLLLMLKGISKRAGVAFATLHRFRRSYCTNLLRGGVDLRTVQSFMGHSDLASTMRYLTPATGEEVRDKINAILGK